MRLRQRGFPLQPYSKFMAEDGQDVRQSSLLHTRLRVSLPEVRGQWDRRKLYASGSNEKANQLPCIPSCVKMAVSVA